MCVFAKIMGIEVGGLLPGDRPQGAGVQAGVGAPEARGAGVGEVAAQGGEANPRDHLHTHQVSVHKIWIQYLIQFFQLGNLQRETGIIQDQGIGEYFSS